MRRLTAAFSASAVAIALSISAVAPALATAERISGFGAGDSAWRVVNDGVMGGVSGSTFVQRKGLATFSGTVRLENNGGFASVRSTDPVRAFAPGASSFDLRVRGDGRPYNFTVETLSGQYWYSFTPPKGRWTTISAPFVGFQPVTRFGEPTDAPPLSATASVQRLGILIANGRAEKFSLQIDWIDVR